MKDKHLRGYYASGIIVEEMMNDAKKKLQPYAKREGRKIDWWRGYYDGLLAAHCFMVLGQYPDAHENPKQIEEALEREKKRREDLMK